MSYREIQPICASSSGFAFPGLCIRIGRDAFEISMIRRIPVVIVFATLLSAPWLLAALIPFLRDPRLAATLITLIVIALFFGFRQTLRLDRDGAWQCSAFLGIPYRRLSLGRPPRVENSGWDWEEIGVYPQVPDPRLHDGDRMVLVEWQTSDRRRTDDANVLMALIGEQIARLH